MKTFKNYLFIPDLGYGGVRGDVSDGYLTEADRNRRMRLPHNNYTLLGIVDECLTAPYAEEFSKEIVDYYAGGQDGYGGYCNYLEDSWMFHLQKATNSMRTLIEKLDLRITDYILRDDSRNNI